MLPDFNGLRKPSDAITHRRSSELNHSATSSQIQSFLQLNRLKKVESCVLLPKSVALSIKNQSTSQQNQSDQTDADASSAQPVFAVRDYTALFYQLWLNQPSWSPILLTKNGWITVRGNGRKKVPLTLGSIQSHYKRHIIIGKRFGRLTNYLMIDIDINSPFHPNNGGLAVIFAAMEAIGLCRYLIVRSSASDGLHIYFPLAQPVKAWALACAAHGALTAHGVSIVGGQCELFPNKKAFNAEHNGHRLPLQNGSFLLDDDFCPISNHKADFVMRWQVAMLLQDEERLQQALVGNVVYASTETPLTDSVAEEVVEVSPVITTPQVLRSATAREEYIVPPIAWSRFGQSNDIMRELANYGDRYMGFKNAADLAAWMKAVAPQLAGYQKFASPRSKQDIEQGNWSWRWAKSHVESAWKHRVGGVDHNANVKADARWRLFAALERVCIDVNIGVTALWKQLSAIAKSCFDKGIAWKTFKKYRDEVIERIKHPDRVGLSRSNGEDINSVSEESFSPKVIEAEPELRETTTQLSTHRCVIAIYSSIFGQFYTPKSEPITRGNRTSEEEAKAPTESAEAEQAVVETEDAAVEVAALRKSSTLKTKPTQSGLAVGQQVRIAMPGGSLDGVETRVVEQTVDVLGQRVYRLDYYRQGRAVTLPAECLQIVEVKERELPGETVVRATAAQLLQVLGKACPFVGPGLWTVKRDEVSASAWRQLSILNSEV